MRWSYEDFLSLPADYVEVAVAWIAERERQIQQAHEDAKRRR